jgi:preprotein translocase subunit SecA
MLALVRDISAHESRLLQCSDAELAAGTVKFKERLLAGVSLEEIQLEAFALVREAAWRVLNASPADTHLIAGLVLHRGKIAEVEAGWEETGLVATLPAYLNALGGKGVHIVACSDFSARRDFDWAGSLYKFLGQSPLLPAVLGYAPFG